ncbi:hypothetical protein SADUNF_Sadunf03G0035500 [Salix dunnii]|uniref:Uncharacterized protein n=1 Tax=Salix dunnii TaxID=1413687 RepID=A0A835N463_9ROSI|nr:hypothetical protein SADUNF_Sadunf03G0035500 [Salix dunnii]
MDNQAKVQRLRQTRDYSFLFSDDNNLTLQVSSTTLGQPPLACNSFNPLINKQVMEKIPSHLSLQRKPIIKAVHHSAQQLAGSNDNKGSKDSMMQHRIPNGRSARRDNGDRNMEASFGDIMKEEKKK